jgi:O-antigen/teichoic acid export membrane protein
MSLGQTIRRGALWQFAGNSGSQLLNFAFGIVLARLLAPHDFGTLVTIQVFTGLAGFVAGGGMGQGLVRAPNATKADYDCVFTLQLLIGCGIYTGFFFAAPWFARWYDQPLYESLLRVSALSFLTRPFINLPATILHRQMRFKTQAAVRIATLITSSTVSIVMAYYGNGVWSLIIGGLTGSVCSMILITYFSGWRPGFTMKFHRAREVARYGTLVSLNDIVIYLRQQATNFILGRTLGPASVGIFNKADSLVAMPHLMVTSSVSPVLFRALALEQSNLDKSRYLYFRSLSLVAIYATPLFMGLYWLAEPLIAVLYGPNWAEAAEPLAILAIAGPFLIIGKLSGAVLAARAWLRRELLVQVILLILTAIAGLAGLRYGLRGIAIGLLLVAIYNAAHMYALASRCLAASWSQLSAALAPALGLCAILYVILFALDRSMVHAGFSQFATLVLMSSAGACVYAVCFLYLPLGRLESEQLRWKRKLRLKSTSPP